MNAAPMAEEQRRKPLKELRKSRRDRRKRRQAHLLFRILPYSQPLSAIQASQPDRIELAALMQTS
jgi:hypothetical protein